MLFNELRKYNTATTLNFALCDPTGAALTTGATFAAGDVKINKDEGTPGNTTNLPTHEGNGQYSLALTATEMSAARICITFDDQTSPELWLGDYGLIQSYGHASAGIVFDLSQATPGVNATQWVGDTIVGTGQTGVPKVDLWYAVSTSLATAASGYLPADVRRVDGVALDTHDAGEFPADVRMVDGVALDTHDAGCFPADIVKIDNAAMNAHLAGMVPADIRGVKGATTTLDLWSTLVDLSESLTVTTQTSNTTFAATAAVATTDDTYIDRVGIFLVGTTTVALRGRPFYVTDYTGASKTFTVDQLNAVPAVGDTFILLP